MDAYQTKRTNFGCECRRSTDFTTCRPQVDDLNFSGVLDGEAFVKRISVAVVRAALTSLGAIGDDKGGWIDGRVDQVMLTRRRIKVQDIAESTIPPGGTVQIINIDSCNLFLYCPIFFGQEQVQWMHGILGKG